VKGRGRLIALVAASLLVVAALWTVIAVRGLSPQLGLDLQGGVSLTLLPVVDQAVDIEVLDQTVEVIRQRVDALGVAEPEITRQGETVQVQLPGVTDREQATEVVGRTAVLQFRRVSEVAFPGTPAYDTLEADCAGGVEGPPPADTEVVLCGLEAFETSTAPADAAPPAEPAPQDRPKYRLQPVAFSGVQVVDAVASLDPSGTQWQVQLDLDDEGGAAFQEVTGAAACEPPGAPSRQIAIVLDGFVESAPTVQESVPCGQGIGDSAVITAADEGEARELAIVLRTGALPIELEFATAQNVSPTLGASSLRGGLIAGGIGLALVAAYLVFLYRGIGLAAVAELGMFGLITVGVVTLLGELAGFTLTLAGIAGIIVSIGIAADSSIIYRERYRDEVRAGRTVRTAADHAFSNAFRTNLTGNTVSLLAALVLYFLAVGPVRGFAFTLGLSTVVDTLIFATFTRGLFGLIARSPKLARSPLVGLRADVIDPTAPRQGGAA